MANMNVQNLEIGKNDFVDFNDIDTEVVIINVDENIVESGLHLIGRGNGDQLWCDYDFNDFYLKFGRIAMMEEGQDWTESHNNLYGRTQTLTIISKEETDDGIDMIMKWNRFTNHSFGDCGSDDDIYDEWVYIIMYIPTTLAEQYLINYWFRRMWNELDADIEASKFYTKITEWEVEDLDEIIEEEIIEK